MPKKDWLHGTATVLDGCAADETGNTRESTSANNIAPVPKTKPFAFSLRAGQRSGRLPLLLPPIWT
jgi:hypothetical protein